MNRGLSILLWTVIALLGACVLGYIALNRGETISAAWIVIAAACVYLIAYRFYSKFIVKNVFQLDATRMTPAVRHNDGLDYVPTNRYVLFGHHFAAIAGAGPLVGPVLAAQMGYLPGMLWLLAGVVFAGAMQDFVILFISMRRDGRSLGELVKMELGPVAGVIALIGTFMIMVIILAVLALVVVKALTNSPWGTFTVGATIPIAILMGLYMRFVRPGHIGEVSVGGFVLLMLAIVLGGTVARSPVMGPWFTFSGTQLTWILIVYGFIAAVLPVWLLLAPRDYLSTFLKLGVIIGLAIAILIVHPMLQMPALTPFVDGTGPVWKGDLFPFLFITIACGAVSGFHALISSGTTPKMVANEADARFIGYGAMLMESLVGIMALIAAAVIEPGAYFAMNAPAAVLNTPAAIAAVTAANAAVGHPVVPDAVRLAQQAAYTISSWHHGLYAVTPDVLTQLAQDVGEKTILGRAGGAPTLAVGMAHILHQIIGGKAMMAFWYHFAILFEALFILTAVDAGTRACRFMLQDLIGLINPSFKRTESLPANLIATALVVAAWGYFVYQGVVDPLGGINTLWPLFGISNQMLAGVALILATVVLFKMKRDRFAWVTIVPTAWLAVCTLVAGLEKVLPGNPSVSFVSHAAGLSAAIANGKLTGPAKTMADMQRMLTNDYVNTVLCIVFIFVVVSMLVFGVISIMRARGIAKPTIHETPYEPMPAGTVTGGAH